MSTSPTIIEWCDQIGDAIARVAGDALRGELDATWEEHATRSRVEITFIGPQDSGKSSVLRRLLADAGQSIPAWLTVSARRETFELNEISLGRVSVTDTPGFGTPNLLHEQLAEDALALSDAFVLIVPPNLVTDQLPRARAILSGEYWFGDAGALMVDKLIAVIAQADTLGIDPEDDVHGMRELAARKARELTAQLEGDRAGSLAALNVIAVAADPYETQARESQPGRSDFDPFREWDGMDQLAPALERLADRLPELRTAAQLRYYARVGSTVVGEGKTVLDGARQAVEDLTGRESELALLNSRGEGLVEQARADLEARLATMFAELSAEISGMQESEVEALLVERASDVVNRWAERFDAELDLLLGEAAAQVDRRLERPAAQHTATFLRALHADDVPPDPSSETNSRVIRLLNALQSDVAKTVRSSFELKFGQQFEKLLTDLDKAKHPKASRAGGPGAGDGVGANASRAAKTAAVLQGAGQLANGLLGIATTLDAERRQQQLDAAAQLKRAKARVKLDRAVTDLASAIIDGDATRGGWRERLLDGMTLLREALGIPDDGAAVSSIHADVASREADLEGLVTLLAAFPREPAPNVDNRPTA